MPVARDNNTTKKPSAYNRLADAGAVVAYIRLLWGLAFSVLFLIFGIYTYVKASSTPAVSQTDIDDKKKTGLTIIGISILVIIIGFIQYYVLKNVKVLRAASIVLPGRMFG